MEEVNELSAEENLYQSWMLYITKKDESLFRNYLQQFIQTFGEFVDVELIQLNEGFMAEGPHLTKLPEGLLQVISQHLGLCSDQFEETQHPDLLEYAEELTKCLIVITRNLDNVAFVASCEYVTQLVNISAVVLSKLATDNVENGDQLTSFVRHVLHLFECLYDPYFIWRKELKGWKTDISRLRFKPALLHMEVVPFFYECFQHLFIDVHLQIHLFQVFGAIVSGAQHNALKAICPATQDVLIKVLSYPTPSEPNHAERDAIITLKELVLKCIVSVVHVLHICSPDKRQVEVGAILEGYFQLFLKMGNNAEDFDMLHKMLKAMDAMLQCPSKAALQVIFVAEGTFDAFLVFLQRMMSGVEVQAFAMAIIRVMKSVLSGCATAKDQFKEKVGYSKFTEALKSLGQPSKELLSGLLEMVIEETLEEVKSLYKVRNAEAAVMLIQWLPDIQSHDLQIWLSRCLRDVCGNDNHSRMQCCTEGVITAILNVLKRQKQISPRAIGNLMCLLESLGTFSITEAELKLLIRQLRLDEEGNQMPYSGRLMHSMSVMARKEGREGPLHYFDFQTEDSGILSPVIQKWPGTSFAFFCWVCLESQTSLFTNGNQLLRRQLYSFSASGSCGFEAFFTADNVLVIATFMKKEYHTIALPDNPLNDQRWHCIAVVHTPSKRPFAQSQLSLYVDGRQRLSALMKVPVLTEPFTVCQVGAPGLKIPEHHLHASTSSDKSLFSIPGLGSIKLAIPNAMKPPASQSSSVVTLALGTESSHYGTPVSLVGHLSSVGVFCDEVSANQIAALYAAGPNSLTLFQLDDNSLSELALKLVVYYNAKACRAGMCLDLSRNQHHGRIIGHKCVTWDIKDVINCIGGMQVLFPLLEQVNKGSTAKQDVDLLLREDSPEKGEPSSPDSDWVVLRSSSYADSNLEHNQVAGFMTLLRNMIQNSVVNQETLVRENAVATLGALLQKVEPSYIDVHVLMAIQLLLEAIAVSNKSLLHHIYQYLLFDFRIWSKSEFPVRIGHIQYLSTIIKEDKRYFRKHYGVQYMLDVIRTYYSSSEESLLSKDDNKTIRGSLLSLIKFYVHKEITYEELCRLMAFLVAVKEESLVSEVLDLLINLLDAPVKDDQLYLLLFEPNTGELLYNLLTVPQYSSSTKEKVLKILRLLLKSEKVYEKSKSRMRLLEAGLYPGLASLMYGSPISFDMVRSLMEQIFLVDGPTSYDAALSIVQLLPESNINIKLEISKQLLTVLCTKTSAAQSFAKQIGWQTALVRLFVSTPRPVNATKRTSLNLSPTRSDDTATPIQSSSSLPDIQRRAVRPASLNPNGEPVDVTDNNNTPSMHKHGSTTSVTDSVGVPSPMFSKRGIFSDPPDHDSDNNITSSRSTSTSSEDISNSSNRPPNAPTTGLPSTFTGVDLFTPGDVTDMPVTSPVTSADDRRDSSSDYGESVEEKIEELSQNLLIVLFTVLWKGVKGSDQHAWKERGQVFAAITYTHETHVMLKSKEELTRRLLELMLDGCITDLKETGQTNTTCTENALELIKLLYQFLCLENGPPAEKFKERIIEDVMTVLDLMTVWDSESEWLEMTQLGLSIILAFAAQANLDLCSIAAARLHTLLQTRPVEKLQESCFVIATVDAILKRSVYGDGDQYSFLLPVMKALMDKCSDMLNMATYLPNLPPTQLSPTFFDDFKSYSQSEEWKSFMKKQVLPSKDQYLANIFDELQVRLRTYTGECLEEMLISSHKRGRQRGEGKLKFQSQIVEPFVKQTEKETKRYENVLIQLKNQHTSLMKQWRTLKVFFTGPRGAWTESHICEEPLHWKLSNQENFSRMRPKLIPNYNFESHVEASRLRDNLGSEESPSSLPPIPLATKAKVSGDEIGDDRLGDEEWKMISAASDTGEDTAGKEKLVLLEECELVTVTNVTKGRLEVTTKHVYYFNCSANREDDVGEDFKWALSQLREIHFRRYNLRRSALEFFLVDQTNYFINFQKKVRNKVYSRILSLRPPNLIYYGSRSPAELLKASGLTQKWVHREVSNFDYLMQLNTIAGRTYNDLSQYPVFPWILADYTSEELDLDDPKVYRDLSKPIGVVNSDNEEEVREKFENFEDPTGTIEKFHYGTHYSNAAGVMHYLVRMEPFTSLHIELQDGRFDVADRQFHSIPTTWQSLIDKPNDVKELIPEFFYLPEYLVNVNGLDLGRLQSTKITVDNVVLPRWANSPEDFIHKHIKALESDHVSQHLHEWIDLIFGYKQKGKAAVEALNVFYYCTYEGAVDLDAITDPMERKALEGMINNFGQTPCQLLKEPHPRRMSYQEAVVRASRSDKPLSVLFFLNQLKAYFVEASVEHDPLVYISVPRSQARSFIKHGMPDSMIGISGKGILGVHGWLPYDKSISNYFTFERDPSLTNSKTRKHLGGPFAPGLQINPKLFAVSNDAKLIFSAGHWDNSLRVYSISKMKMVGHIVRHFDIVTCLSLDYCGSHLITGSRDTTCMIWELSHQSGSTHNLKPSPIQILQGHDEEVTSVAISVELDMAVSASKDGTVIIHTVRKGTCVRTLYPPHEAGWNLTVEQLAISDIGQICLYCKQTPANHRGSNDEKLSLYLYWINGKHLHTEVVFFPISHMLIASSHPRNYLIYGNQQGVLVIKELIGLKTLASVPLHIPITCVAVTSGNSHVLAGLSDGKLIIVGIGNPPEVR